MTIYIAFVIANLWSEKPIESNIILISGLLVSIDPHYFLLISSLIIYKYQNWVSKLIQISGLALISFLYVYYSFGYEGVKSVYI